MVKQSEDIDIKLIHDEVHTGLSQKQEQCLEDWVLASKRHRTFYEKAHFYYKTRSVHDAIPINKGDAWSKIDSRLKPGRRHFIRRWYAVAGSVAAILALVTLVTLVLQQPERKMEIAHQVTSIKPGHRSAELILSNGQKVRLGQGSQELTEENGTKINLASEEVIYMADVPKATVTDLKNTIRVDRGEEFTLVLADGTKVWINSMSELRFPVNFNKEVREVEILNGEACFDVAHDNQRPFIVKTPGHNIKVLGTTFNVSCYENDYTIETTLVEGLIEINNQVGNSAPVIIRPDQQYVYSKNTLDANVRRVHGANYVAWTKGVFIFEDESLESIFKTLERWYDINVFYEANEKRSQVFNGRLPRFENVDVILNMIEKVSDVEFDLQENTVVIK